MIDLLHFLPKFYGKISRNVLRNKSIAYFALNEGLSSVLDLRLLDQKNFRYMENLTDNIIDSFPQEN